MKKSVKRIFNSMLAFCLALGCLAFPASAATKSYNPQNALQYAANTWDNGVELCAGYVSNCLKAGGLSSWDRECTNLFNKLNREVVQGAKIAQVYTLKTSGNYIKTADNKGKLSKGDVLFWRCPGCPYDRVGGDYQHTAIVSDVSGTYVQVYQHNGAVNNQPAWVGSCYECGRAYQQMVVVHFESAPAVSLDFSTSAVTLNVGQTQNINFSFKGNAVPSINSISFGFGDDSKENNSLGKASFGSVDWSKGNGTISLQCRSGETGQTTFTVWLWDAKGKVLAQKTIPFKVNSPDTGTSSEVPSTLEIKNCNAPSSLSVGQYFDLTGEITSNYPLSSVRGYIRNEKTGKLESDYTMKLSGKSFSVLGSQLDYHLYCNKLPANNTFTIHYTARDVSGKQVDWQSAPFSVRAKASTIAFSGVKAPSSLKRGSYWSLQGKVSSNYPLRNVTGQIVRSKDSKVMYSKTINLGNSQYTYKFYDSSIDMALLFNKLGASNYFLQYTATDTSGKSITWKSNAFTVK